MKRDFVAELVGVVTEVASLDAGAQQRIEQTIRQRFGGERLPIYPTAPLNPEQVMRQIDEGLRQRKSIDEIAAEVGRHRSSLYRYLGKSRKQRQK